LNILQLINVRWYNACAHYAVTVSHALSRIGHQVIVAGDPQSPPILKAKELGLTVNQDISLSRNSPWMMAYNVKRMVDLVKGEKIDVVNAHRGESHVAAALTNRLLKKKTVLVRTRGDVRTPSDNLFSRYLNGKLTDGIITTCDVLRKSYISGLKINKEKLLTIPVGIDHNVFSPRGDEGRWRQRLRLTEGSPVVGMVGRLSPVKGHRFFIESAKLVLKRVPQGVFVICGEDAQISSCELKNKVRDMGMEKNFRFLGRVKDIREIISLFDVGVVSSVGSETVCRVALEYMSMGKPVVGTRINAIPEVIVHGVNGFLVEPGIPEQMSEALTCILENQSEKVRFGQNSRNLVLEKFTLDHFARKTEKVYLDLLNNL
jgi:glycosyltransferase involved in cell wall biosynthesis